MIVKKLRDKHGWSQEQLAEFCDLNVRTIQRVESGQKASMETLKCLASVLEVNIEQLTEEITVIDKESESWKALPWWYRANMIGIYKKRTMIWFEIFFLVGGFVFWFFIDKPPLASAFFLCAYISAVFVRYGDERRIW
ncbi:MAG: helix-turn-helix transcriptional regulator [Gammaproteobacteria bacterium]|nr:helix-turn-helix transcriptional regulator [Gammaproteobacteria bacterium]